MSTSPTRTSRDRRREARTAVSDARKAGREAAKLAKTLSRDARAKFEARTAVRINQISVARAPR